MQSQGGKAERRQIEFMLRKHLGPRQDLDDLVQTVYVELLRSLPRFRGESSLPTFIGGITLMVIKRARRGTAWETKRAPFEVETEAASPSPERTAIEREQIRQLARALARIAEPKRAAFLMWSLGGLSPQEIASRTDASVAATRSRIFYAKKELSSRAEKDDALRELV